MLGYALLHHATPYYVILCLAKLCYAILMFYFTMLSYANVDTISYLSTNYLIFKFDAKVAITQPLYWSGQDL